MDSSGQYGLKTVVMSGGDPVPLLSPRDLKKPGPGSVNLVDLNSVLVSRRRICRVVCPLHFPT